MKEIKGKAWDKLSEREEYLFQKAKAEVAGMFQKAIKDLREGKDIDLAEREFEVFFSIRNDGLSEGYGIGKTEVAREIFEEFEKLTTFPVFQIDWQSLKDRFLKEEK